MRHNVMLTIASLLSILLFSIHLTDDIVRGMEPGTAPTRTAVPILALWRRWEWAGWCCGCQESDGYRMKLVAMALTPIIVYGRFMTFRRSA